MPMSKVDWSKARKEYVTTRVGQQTIANKYGVSLTTVQRRACKEHWTEQRQDYRNSVTDKAIRKSANKEAALLAKEFDTASALSDVLNKAAKSVNQFNKYIVSDMVGDGVSQTYEARFDKIDMKALKDAAQAVKIIEQIKRSIKGIMTEEQKQQLKMAREKLDLERAKSMIGDDDDNETGVIVLAPTLPANDRGNNDGD